MGAFCSDCLTRQQNKFDEDILREETMSLLVANDQNKIDMDCQSQSNAFNNQVDLKSINLKENNCKQNNQAKSEKNFNQFNVMQLDDSFEDINARQKQNENLKKYLRYQKNAIYKKKLKNQMKLLKNKKIVDLKDVNLQFLKFPKLNIMKQQFKKVQRQYEYINEYKLASTNDPKFATKKIFKMDSDTNNDLINPKMSTINGESNIFEIIEKDQDNFQFSDNLLSQNTHLNKTKMSTINGDSNIFEIIEKDQDNYQFSDKKLSQKISSSESSLKDLIQPNEIN